jgi:hypothetical protein
MGFVQRDDVRKQISEELGEIRPVLKNGVLLLLDEVNGEQCRDSGIILLDGVTRDLPYRYATVLAIGGSVRSVATDDRVILGKFFGKEIPYRHSSVCKLAVVSEDQIDAILIQG